MFLLFILLLIFLIVSEFDGDLKNTQETEVRPQRAPCVELPSLESIPTSRSSEPHPPKSRSHEYGRLPLVCRRREKEAVFLKEDDPHPPTTPSPLLLPPHPFPDERVHVQAFYPRSILPIPVSLPPHPIRKELEDPLIPKALSEDVRPLPHVIIPPVPIPDHEEVGVQTDFPAPEAVHEAPRILIPRIGVPDEAPPEPDPREAFTQTPKPIETKDQGTEHDAAPLEDKPHPKINLRKMTQASFNDGEFEFLGSQSLYNKSLAKVQELDLDDVEEQFLKKGSRLRARSKMDREEEM